MKLLFTTSDNIISKIIQKFTWHWSSHCAITDGIDVYECNHIDGCCVIPIVEWEKEHEGQRVETIKVDVDKAEVIKRLNADLGASYDFFGLVTHLFRSDVGSHRGHNCTSYVAKAINYDGSFIPHMNYHRLQPRHLMLVGHAHNKAIKNG